MNNSTIKDQLIAMGFKAIVSKMKHTTLKQAVLHDEITIDEARTLQQALVSLVLQRRAYIYGN